MHYSLEDNKLASNACGMNRLNLQIVMGEYEFDFPSRTPIQYSFNMHLLSYALALYLMLLSLLFYPCPIGRGIQLQ
jgi:hypothetical protein